MSSVSRSCLFLWLCLAGFDNWRCLFKFSHTFGLLIPEAPGGCKEACFSQRKVCYLPTNHLVIRAVLVKCTVVLHQDPCHHYRHSLPLLPTELACSKYSRLSRFIWQFDHLSSGIPLGELKNKVFKIVQVKWASQFLLEKVPTSSSSICLLHLVRYLGVQTV